MVGAHDYYETAEEVAHQLSTGQDDVLWQSAKQSFIASNRPEDGDSKVGRLFQEFLATSESVKSAQRTCTEIQKQADDKYMTGGFKTSKGKMIVAGDWLKKTISAMDSFIAVGDIAFKGSAETVSLGWTAVRWVLQAVTADADRCQQWAEASEKIARILLTCRTIGGLYKSARRETSSDIVTQLLREIPQVYEAILTFSWAAKRQVEKSGLGRMFDAVNPFSSAGDASTNAYDKIQAYYKQVNDDSQTAFQQIVTQTLDSIGDGQRESRKTMLAMGGQVTKLFDLVSDSVRRIKHTPRQMNEQLFEENKMKLGPLEHSKTVFDLKLGLKIGGSCEWIFKDSTYRSWLASSRSSLLRLSGGSGLGKSVMTSTVISRLLEDRHETDSAVAFFYCLNTGGSADTQSFDRILRDIVYRIYEKSKVHDDYLADANRLFFKRDGKGKNNEDSSYHNQNGRDAATSQLPPLSDTLVSLVKILKKQVFIIIDALDECPQADNEELCNAFDAWLQEQGITIKIFVSGRPEGVSEERLERHPTINLKEHNSKDIASYAESTLAGLNLSNHEKTAIRETLLARADGQFTYINIARDILRQPWKRPVGNVIVRLQGDVTRLNQETLKLVDPNYIDLAKTALTWTLLRQGELHVGQFFDIYSRRYTATSDTHEVSHNADDRFNSDAAELAPASAVNYDLYRAQIDKAAGSFVRVTPKRYMQEQHQNVKDCFLLKPQGQCESGYYYVSPRVGHLHLTFELLKNLNSEAFCRRHMAMKEENAGFATDAELRHRSWHEWETPRVNPRTASVHVGHHYTGVDLAVASDHVSGATQSFTETSKPAGINNGQVSSTFTGKITQATSTSDGEQSSQAQGAHSTDLHSNSPQHDDKYDDTDSEDEHDDTENYAAWREAIHKKNAANDRYEAWKWFIHLKLAETTAGSEHSETGQAWEDVWKELRKFFLDRKRFRTWHNYMRQNWRINKEIKRSIFWDPKLTPFHLCVGFGLTWAIRRMIEEGASLWALDDDLRLPIHYFGYNKTMNEDADLLDLLMKLNDVNWQNQNLDAPFCRSAFESILWNNPTEEILGTLMRENPTCRIANASKYNALHLLAMSSTRPGAVRRLVDAGVDINASDQDGEAPLHYLLHRRDREYYDVLDTFLECGANVNQESANSEQPLVGVAMSGDLRAAKALLGNTSNGSCADVTDTDARGATALAAAAANGHVDLIRYLISKGADVNHKSARGYSVLYNACRYRRDRASVFLIATLRSMDISADEIDCLGEDGKGPLRRACSSGSLEAVQALLAIPNMEARLNIQDSIRGRTCLHAAAFKGYGDIIKLLLECGALPFEDKRGKTPLQLCGEAWIDATSNNSYEAVALLLLPKSTKSSREQASLLFAAASVGSVKVIQVLLDRGINPNITDEHGWKPIHLARHHGNEDAATALEHGGISGYQPSSLRFPLNVTTLDSEGSNVYVRNGEHIEALLVANHPIRIGDPHFYFEVDLLPGEEEPRRYVVGLGLSTATDPGLDRMPGWYHPRTQSFGYHSDDGYLYGREYWEKDLKWPTASPGQTMGCGLDVEAAKLYFTHEGRLLGAPFSDVRGRLFAVVGMGAHSKVKVNFEGPFKYDPKREEESVP